MTANSNVNYMKNKNESAVDIFVKNNLRNSFFAFWKWFAKRAIFN